MRVRIASDNDNDKRFDDGSDIARLAALGIEVRLDDTPFHMHHKFAIFDGTSIANGSFNWTRSASSSNHERGRQPDLVRSGVLVVQLGPGRDHHGVEMINNTVTARVPGMGGIWGQPQLCRGNVSVGVPGAFSGCLTSFDTTDIP